jgi:hypothetical protein
VDLNHRPLGYEILKKRIFHELAGVVAYFREWKIAVKSAEELLFWVGFGLASLVSNGFPSPSDRFQVALWRRAATRQRRDF